MVINTSILTVERLQEVPEELYTVCVCVVVAFYTVSVLRTQKRGVKANNN